MCFLLLAVNAAYSYAPWAANIGNGCPLGYQYGGYGSTTMCVPKSGTTQVAEATQAHLKNRVGGSGFRPTTG